MPPLRGPQAVALTAFRRARPNYRNRPARSQQMKSTFCPASPLLAEESNVKQQVYGKMEPMLVEFAPSWLTKPFWDAAANSRLVFPRCSACLASFFSPQIACPSCLSEAWAWETSSGRGVIHSAATVHRPPDASIAAPYVLAIVTLDEGWKMLTNIVNCRPATAVIDRRVHVIWSRRTGGRVVPTFELEQGESAGDSD
jgi:uncharacterized protein